MKDIHKLGLRGRLPTFIESFLADRAMQVRVGSTLSDLYDQEQGVPQGGVLSTTLFNITLESPYHLVAVSGAHFTQGTILIVILVSSGSAKSRIHQSAVGGFLVTRRGWPGRLRACRIWTFINSV